MVYAFYKNHIWEMRYVLQALFLVRKWNFLSPVNDTGDV